MNIELKPGWVSVALDEVFEPRSNRVSPHNFPESPYVGLEHVEAHSSKLLGTVSASTMNSSAARFFAGDVLYGRMRPYLNKVVLLKFNGLASAEFIIFPETFGIDNKFLLFRFLSSDFVEFACSQYEGDRPRVKFEQLGKFQLHLPPAAEQTRIVAKLEELLSDLDAGVAELKAAQKKLAQYRQSLLKAAVEGALTADWRQHNPPQETGAQLLERILIERRSRWEAKQLAKFASQGKAPPKGWQSKYPAPVAPDVAGLPELPQGWVWASLDQLVGESSYGTSVKCGYENQGVPVLRIPNVVARKLVLDDLKFSSEKLDLEKDEYISPGDILIVRTNGSISLVGRAAEICENLPKDYYFASYLLRVRCVEVNIMPRWISALLASSFGRSWIEARAASSAGQHNISLSTLLSISIPIPSLVEQAEALDSVESALSNVLQQESMLVVSLKQSTTQRQNILRAAFSGQLVPQDPSDEPASVLLERIRAERAAQASVPKVRKARAVKGVA